jgi:hypothetical protein
MEFVPAPTELAKDDVLLVYRVVRTDDRESPDFIDSFRSHSELGLPPRSLEVTHPQVFEGVSVWDTRKAAIETARCYPKLGNYVAELRLTRDTGVTYYRWRPRGHLTIWADALNLVNYVVDTICVDKGKEN